MKKNYYIIPYVWLVVLLYTQTLPKFTLSSPAFKNNDYIPANNACDGQNLSPALQWSNAPKKTQSFALIVDDPDASDKIWVHWLIFNISPITTMLQEGGQQGFISGETDFYYMKHGIWQYGGPCPPTGTHHYHFTIYALDTMLKLDANTNKEDLLNAMQGHILAQATLIGLYARKK